jgi:Tfp pilus assembly protein PilF
MAEARGDLARTRDGFQRAADLLRQIGETRWLILALAHLGGTYDADPRRAESIYLEALELAEASGDIRGAAIAKGNLGYHLFERGDERRAVMLIEEALAGHRELADVYGIAACLSNLAQFALRRGDLDAAAANLRESLELSYSIRDTLSLSSTLSGAAALVLARGDPEAAARLCAADEELLTEHGFETDQRLGETMQAAHDVLGERFDEIYGGARNLDLASAVELAVDALDSDLSQR